MNSRLVILQPYVPQYRKQFFEKLIARLRTDGIDCVVAAGQPRGAQAVRGDSSDPSWVLPVSSFELSIAGRSLNLGGTYRAWKNADAVIVDHEGSSLEVFRAILGARRAGRRVGLWGHIASYVGPRHPVDAALERWQLRHADHVFAYTSGGAQFALSAGVAQAKVTTVMNTVATDAIREASESLTVSEIHDFATDNSLTPGRTFAFVGGLDSSKRIKFLVEMLDHLWAIDPEVRLIVGGNGDESNLFDRAKRRGQAIIIGYAGAREFAMIGKVADAILMPGRIGLIAVEALALHIPIVTTDWPYHAPEVEYLREGFTKFTAPNNPESFAQYILSRKFNEGGAASDSSWVYPSLDDMVENYARGVRALLA